MKTAMRKTIGNVNLTFDELKEVLLDVEVALIVAIQQLYPLELSCDRAGESTATALNSTLNPEATHFRPRRDAAVAAGLRIQDIASTLSRIWNIC